MLQLCLVALHPPLGKTCKYNSRRIMHQPSLQLRSLVCFNLNFVYLHRRSIFMKLEIFQAFSAHRAAKKSLINRSKYRVQQHLTAKVAICTDSLSSSSGRRFPSSHVWSVQLLSKHTKICKGKWFQILRDDKQQKTSMISVITVQTKFSIYCKACFVRVLEFWRSIPFQPLN